MKRTIQTLNLVPSEFIITTKDKVRVSSVEGAISVIFRAILIVKPSNYYESDAFTFRLKTYYVVQVIRNKHIRVGA